MSLCMFAMSKDAIVISGDSAISSDIDNKRVRLIGGFTKLKIIGNYIVFCGGTCLNALIAFNYIEKHGLDGLSSYLRENIAPPIDSKNYELEVLAFDGNGLKQLSSYNNYEMVFHRKPEIGSSIGTAGFKVEESDKLLRGKIRNGMSVNNAMIEVYKELSCAEIGGVATIYTIGLEGVHCRHKVIDNMHGYELQSIDDLVRSEAIIGNELHVENESLTFKVDTEKATLLNADFIIENDRNKLLLSPNDGIKIQKKNGNTLEDKFYADANGDLVLKGTIYATNGEFSGDITGSTITASTLNGGTITGTAIKTDNFSVDEKGNVVANNLRLLGGEINLNDLIVNGTISFDNLPPSIASIDDIPTKTQIQNIASTQITGTLVSSPRIEGSIINGGTINGVDITGSEFLQVGSKQRQSGDIGIKDGRLYLYPKDSGGNAINAKGLLTYDTNGTNKVYLQSNNVPLKIESINADMSLDAIGGKVWMGSDLWLKEGNRIFKANGEEITGGGGVAVFG